MVRRVEPLVLYRCHPREQFYIALIAPRSAPARGFAHPMSPMPRPGTNGRTTL